MNSREKILQAVLQNQPPLSELPDVERFKGIGDGSIHKYIDVFATIGGKAVVVEDIVAVKEFINKNFDIERRVITTLKELSDNFELISGEVDPHTYEDTELAVISAHFCVAENGAVWVTDELMGQRITPFICQHLAVIVKADNVVPTLHEAYDKIGKGDYGFGCFIGGPSKTADIEQALVLGAHGPLSMTVFIIKE